MLNTRCFSGKRAYEDEQLAVEALIQAHVRNEFSGGQGPVNVYKCEDCGFWHFTSKGNRNDIFEDPDTISRIKKERIAYQWEQRLK